ncbi:NUDIX domain-containing protein [Clostridium bowmanii]|uniref:NUDIX hydrolase n=1 Tax=Clostridium bowmanii TaxID=132925 RepID=UPI001C0A957E|nr:NUDIX domain-containing protein [Clostridium bowmanii]MBU3191856.1 NUDIX domain-containing protein [Clostridium bowmanii]MCA1076154.1 NUDIX domain-containing protein [Clostridium bowmanii]
MDISFKTDEGRFNYRVAGIIVHNNKLLIMKDACSPYFYIPGGRVKMNELSENAISREVREELHVNIKINRLLWVNENFFQEETSDERFHEICFYYLLDMIDDKLTNKGNEFILKENGEHDLSFYWKDIEKINDLNIYPLFIKKNILQLPQVIEHVVEIKD